MNSPGESPAVLHPEDVGVDEVERDLQVAQPPSHVLLLVGEVLHEGGRLPGDVEGDALRHLDAVLGLGVVAVLEVEDVPRLSEEVS